MFIFLVYNFCMFYLDSETVGSLFAAQDSLSIHYKNVQQLPLMCIGDKNQCLFF